MPDKGVLGVNRFTDGEIRVYLRCFDNSMKFSWIKAPWYPGATPQDAQLLIVCPWCDQQVRIAGYSKTFKYDILTQPVPILLPGKGGPVEQTHNLTVEEDCGCARCRKMFRLTDNVLSGV
jgi:hypothetical protein